MQKTFEHNGRVWRVIARWPNGVPDCPAPYLVAVPWDKRRKRWKTARSACVFPTDSEGRPIIKT